MPINEDSEYSRVSRALEDLGFHITIHMSTLKVSGRGKTRTISLDDASSLAERTKILQAILRVERQKAAKFKGFREFGKKFGKRINGINFRFLRRRK